MAIKCHHFNGRNHSVQPSWRAWLLVICINENLLIKWIILSKYFDTETPSFIEGSHVPIGTQVPGTGGNRATPEPDESHDVSEDEGDPLTDRPSLHRQREETQTEELQSTLQDGASALGGPPELDVSGIPNKKTWPDPHFCQKCGWIGQGEIRKKLKKNLQN